MLIYNVFHGCRSRVTIKPIFYIKASPIKVSQCTYVFENLEEFLPLSTQGVTYVVELRNISVNYFVYVVHSLRCPQ